ncbi:MAG: hypothetical protein AAGF67_07670 [Verrucomicrobiota bacterium]
MTRRDKMKARHLWPYLLLLFIALAALVYLKFPNPSRAFPMNPYGPTAGTTTIHPQLVKWADEFALEGSRRMADRKPLPAIVNYSAAILILPYADITEPRRRAYEKQWRRAWTFW